MPLELVRPVPVVLRRDPDNLESRAACAEALIRMGELSAARQALKGAVVAPRTVTGIVNVLQRNSSCWTSTCLPATSGVPAVELRAALQRII